MLGRAGGDGGLDQHQAFGLDAVGDDVEGLFQGAHLHPAVAHVAELVLRVVELDVDDHAVGELEHVVDVGGDEGLLLEHAAGDHRIDLGVLGLDRRDALLSTGIFQ